MWDKYKVDYILAICISKSDSNLWKQLASSYNLWNVWNTDGWNRLHLNSWSEWIEYIFRALNNKYLWKLTKVGELSNWWRKVLWMSKCWKCYATSESNWNSNVINCLRNVYQDYKINEKYEFRLK